MQISNILQPWCQPPCSFSYWYDWCPDDIEKKVGSPGALSKWGLRSVPVKCFVSPRMPFQRCSKALTDGCQILRILAIRFKISSLPDHMTLGSAGGSAARDFDGWGQKNLEGIAVILWFCAFAQYQSGDDPGDRGRAPGSTSTSSSHLSIPRADGGRATGAGSLRLGDTHFDFFGLRPLMPLEDGQFWLVLIDFDSSGPW